MPMSHRNQLHIAPRKLLILIALFVLSTQAKGLQITSPCKANPTTTATATQVLPRRDYRNRFTRLLGRRSATLLRSLDRALRPRQVLYAEPSTVVKAAPRVQIPGISGARVSTDGRNVDISFEDGSMFRFHSLWLRDASRDHGSVAGNSGERYLSVTPVGPFSDIEVGQVAAKESKINEKGELVVNWVGDVIDSSTFSGEYLRAYANVVAQPLEEERQMPPFDIQWLEPYTGFRGSRGPKIGTEAKLWKGQQTEFSRYDYHQVLEDPTTGLHMLKTLMRDGAVLVDNSPMDGVTDGALCRHFCYEAIGGIQKDPTRDEPNWMIRKKVNASSISYDHDKVLIQHTDQSCPPYGIPGVVLCMHYVEGQGANTLVDAFAIAEYLRETDPEAFEMLSTYEYDAERDFQASRVDSAQNHHKRYFVSRRNRVLDLDDDGNVKKVIYHEVFRTAMQLPYDIFPKYMRALDKFAKLLHDDEFQVTVPMKKGTFLLMNNWRVLHGRKGGAASASRVVCGGTILREAFYAKAVELTERANAYGK